MAKVTSQKAPTNRDMLATANCPAPLAGVCVGEEVAAPACHTCMSRPATGGLQPKCSAGVTCTANAKQCS